MSEKCKELDGPAPFSEGATASLVVDMLGEDDWSGHNPYEIQIVDTEASQAYILELRKGHDWMTIQRRKSDNPRLVENYMLELIGEDWKYTDPYLMKYGESSLEKLEEVYGLLQKVHQANLPPALEAGTSALDE